MSIVIEEIETKKLLRAFPLLKFCLKDPAHKPVVGLKGYATYEEESEKVIKKVVKSYKFFILMSFQTALLPKFCMPCRSTCAYLLISVRRYQLSLMDFDSEYNLTETSLMRPTKLTHEVFLTLDKKSIPSPKNTGIFCDVK